MYITVTKLNEYRADQLALQEEDILRTIEGYLLDFETARREGRVRCDNPADFNGV